jgi:hypothetical protein
VGAVVRASPNLRAKSHKRAKNAAYKQSTLRQLVRGQPETSSDPRTRKKILMLHTLTLPRCCTHVQRSLSV